MCLVVICAASFFDLALSGHRALGKLAALHEAVASPTQRSDLPAISKIRADHMGDAEAVIIKLYDFVWSLHRVYEKENSIVFPGKRVTDPTFTKNLQMCLTKAMTKSVMTF
mgnify:CR=1 FL=1